MTLSGLNSSPANGNDENLTVSPPEMETRQTPPDPLRGLLLDLDGTVCDTHGLIQQCLDHILRMHLGQPARYEIWQENVGLPLDVVLRATYAHYGQTLDENALPALYDTYRAHMRENCESIRAFPSVAEMLKAFAARGVRLAIVTTKRHEMARRHLQTSGIEELFEFVVAWEDTEAHKPDPAPFTLALERFGLPAESVAHVGDSPHDIVGARAAGIFAVAALWGADNRPALLVAHPDALAEQPDQLNGLW